MLTLNFIGVILLVWLLELTGCSPAGVQGGVISKSFSGIVSLTPISPTAVEIKWTLNPRFIKYKVYRKEVAESIKEETFGSTIVSNLSPLTKYEFSVTGVTEKLEEEGLGSFSSVSTFGHFNGISDTNLAVKSPTQIIVTWASENENISYEVYSKVKDLDFDFNSPVTSMLGISKSFENLTPGTGYCFFIIAKYRDGTSEPSTDKSNIAPCSNTQTDITVIPKVSINPVVFGNYPWFLVSGAEANMKTEVFKKSLPPLVDIRLAQITGNGSLRSGVELPNENSEFFAKVTQFFNSGATRSAVIDLEITTSSLLGINLSSALIRNFNTTETWKAPLFPDLLSEGLGSQSLGTSIAKGDFNCDGLPDLAVSAPDATPYISSQHEQQQGAVIIYYSKKEINNSTLVEEVSFKTDVPPSTSAIAPNPQLIYYPANSNFKLGTKLLSGNFNNDCLRARFVSEPYVLEQVRGNCDTIYEGVNTLVNPAISLPDGSFSSALYQNINRCDDLVIAINSSYNTGNGSKGGLFVLYGDPATGLVTSSGTNNYGLNEQTCDLFSGSCRAGFFSHYDSTNISRFGRALAVGDFNNDGYDDIAVSNYKTVTSKLYGNITVLRGSGGGILPFLSTTQTLNFAEILSNGGNFYTTVPDRERSPQTDYGFGFSVAAVPNSRQCKTFGSGGTTISPRTITENTRYDFTKCNDLVIGDPARSNDRGSVVSCVGVNGAANTTTLTKEQRTRISNWSCSAHYPVNLEDGAMYGYSVTGVANQNGYPMHPLAILDGGNANLAGALFVGAPYADVPDSATVALDPQGNGHYSGKVFGYYVTPSTNGQSQGIQKILGVAGVGGTETSHNIDAENTVACDTENDGITNDRCKNQVIYIPSSQSNMNFGFVISSLDDVRFSNSLDGIQTHFDKTNGLPLLAVSAPNRSAPGPNSTSISGAGGIYIFTPDFSAVTGSNKSSCVSGASILLKRGLLSETCYSGGISPYGPTLVYPDNSVANQNFGLGGAVGDNFNGYNGTDIIASAPYNTNSFRAGTSFPKVERHGNIYQFNSGTNGFSPTETTPTVMSSISVNISKELNYRFDMATSVGDVDHDGYDDVITKTLIGLPTRVVTVLLYGSAHGLIVTPKPSLNPGRHQPTLITASTDPNMGVKIYRVGDINGDGFADVLLVGQDSSYLYYGSSVGLITNSDPAYTPVGKNPLKFGTYKNDYSIYFGINSTSPTSTKNTTWGNDTSKEPSAYAFDTNSVGYGDFNGDGYGDIAVGIDDMRSTYSSSLELPINYSSTYFSINNRGKVIIIYGSKLGLQVDATGVINVNDPNQIAGLNPCSGGSITSANYHCKIQVLSSPDSSLGKSFGFSVQGIPPMNVTNKEWSLLVSDPNEAVSGTNTDGAVYFYRGGLSGLDIEKTSIKTLRLPSGIDFDKQRFGYRINLLGDVNADGISDIAISAPGPYPNSGLNNGAVYIFYGYLESGFPSFIGLPSALDQPITESKILALNTRFATNNSTDIKIQRIRPPLFNTDTTSLFGYGLTSLGDFNGDGFADLAINVPKGDYEDTVKITQAGFVIVYFGSKRGFLIDGNDGGFSTNPKCLGSDSTAGVCDSYQIILPGVQNYENSYINKNSSGDFNGDGHPDLLIGGTGRDHPSGLAFSTGVVYVFY